VSINSNINLLLKLRRGIYLQFKLSRAKINIKGEKIDSNAVYMYKFYAKKQKCRGKPIHQL